MSTQSSLPQRAANHHRTVVPISSSWPVFVAAILYGALVLVIDYAINDVLLTPMLALWYLMVIAFFRRPADIAIIAMILWVFVLWSLRHETMSVVVVRSISFLIGSILAFLFATQKHQAAERYQQIFRIIQSVPANVVAADLHGTIIAASDMSLKLIDHTYWPVCGHMFTDVFMPHHPPATALRIYREWFQRAGSFECDIQLLDQDHKPMIGIAECSGSGHSRILLVVFKSAI